MESLPVSINKRRFVPDEYFELKTKIHDRLLDLIDLSLLETLDQNVLKSEIKDLMEKILREDGLGVPLNLVERERLFTEIQDEVFGLGPLEPFLQDPKVSE
jgi:pilus assembly protein CpaF